MGAGPRRRNVSSRRHDDNDDDNDDNDDLRNQVPPGNRQAVTEGSSEANVVGSGRGRKEEKEEEDQDNYKDQKEQVEEVVVTIGMTLLVVLWMMLEYIVQV